MPIDHVCDHCRRHDEAARVRYDRGWRRWLCWECWAKTRPPGRIRSERRDPPAAGAAAANE